MLSRNLEQTLHRALALATERRHEYATLEHLLLALTEDQDASPVLKACRFIASITSSPFKIAPIVIGTTNGARLRMALSSPPARSSS